MATGHQLGSSGRQDLLEAPMRAVIAQRLRTLAQRLDPKRSPNHPSVIAAERIKRICDQVGWPAS